MDGNVSAAKALWSAPSRYEYVGISEAFLGLEIARVLDEVGPRTLIVERDPEDVIRSFVRYAGLQGVMSPGEDAHLRAEIMRLKARLDAVNAFHPLVRRVAYEDLSNIDMVRASVDWLIPGEEPINLPQLMHLNVQSDLDYNLARLRALRAA